MPKGEKLGKPLLHRYDHEDTDDIFHRRRDLAVKLCSAAVRGDTYILYRKELREYRNLYKVVNSGNLVCAVVGFEPEIAEKVGLLAIGIAWEYQIIKE